MLSKINKVLFTFAILLVLALFHKVSASSLTAFHSELEQAVADYEDEQFESAEKKFLSILESDKKHLKSIIYLARINQQTNELDDAEEYVELALKLAPDSAEVQYLSGQVYGDIAQDASVFTALGYAENCLNGFRKAVELKPDNIDYRLSLMNFHLSAPGIAGGDKKIAIEQAKAIQLIDQKRGFIALLNVYHSMEDKAAVKLHLRNIPKQIAGDSDILFNKGLVEQNYDQYDAAVISFQKAIDSAGEQEEFVVSKYAAIYQIGRTGVLTNQNVASAIDSLKRYIAEAPEGGSLPSKEWAEFRLANLIETQGKKKEAKAIYRKIAEITKDKRLKKQAKKKL